MIKHLLLLTALVASNAVAQTLPDLARNILDSKYPNWQVMVSDSVFYTKHEYVKKSHPVLFNCFLNDDTIPDFAIAFVSMNKQYYAAFVSMGKTYSFYILEELPEPSDLSRLVNLSVHQAGKPVADFEGDNDTRIL